MEFRILGPLEVWQQGEPLPIRGSKQRALLAVLLLHANEVVSTDRLLDLLWGDEPPQARTTALRVRVSQLRKALGSGEGKLRTQAPGYVLLLAPGELDLHRFEQFMSAAERAEPAAAAELLGEALGLWRGPPLADLAFETFAQAAIRRLEELRLVALERRIEADLMLGQATELVGELQALVAEHPLRERFRGQLMLALYRSGRQAEALDVYRATREVLFEQLAIEPSPALRGLEQKILQQDPSLAPAVPVAPQRSILVVPHDEGVLDDLIALGELLARSPPRELLIAQLITADDLTRTEALLRDRREALLAGGTVARVAAFTSDQAGCDVVRLATEQDVDLLLLDAGPTLLEDELTRAALEDAPCDVAILAASHASSAPGPVLVPFAGAEHDWSAIELAAWVARAQGVSLRLAGPRERGRDASRLLASASLAVQRALGVAAEPFLVEPGADGLVRAARGAALVVVGLSERWRKEGLGSARSALLVRTGTPTLLVRSGLRPGGLAPPESHTRFTWSLRPG